MIKHLNLKSVEYFNKRNADYVLENYGNIKEHMRPSTTTNYDPLMLLKKYVSKGRPHCLEEFNDEIKAVVVDYIQNNNIGRHFAVGGLSLQSLQREIRHIIAGDYYVDIDIKNCHPTLIYQYAEKNDLSSENIKFYIENREQIFNDYTNKFNVSKEDVKKAFLSILNGGKSFLGLSKKNIPPFVNEFKNDVELIQNYIFENEATYKKLGIKNAKKKQETNNKTSSNELGSTMNILLCDHENNILQIMINYLQNKGLYKTSLIKVFDGFMIFKNDLKGVDIDLLLIDLEKEVFIKTNYKIKLEVKPMIKIIDVPEDYEMKNTNENLDNVNPIKNDLDGALQILQKLEGKIYKCKDILYYKHDNKWITDLKLIHDLLKSFILDAEFVKYKKATKKDILEGEDIIQILGVDYCLMKFEHYSSDNTGATNILNVLLSKISINGTLIQNILNSSKQKIFFNNGYFDFKKMEFINNFDGVETMVKIEREFVERNIEDEEKVLNLIFKPIFNEDVNEALLFFSRALAGEVVDKLWGVMMGSRDAGKGVNQDAIIAAFQDYIKPFNANSLILDKTGGDAAKKLSWAYDFDKHRLAFSNEMKIDNSIVIDGNLIKQLCSGGDTLLVRKNNIDEKECNPQATVCFCCNDIPKIEPSDVYEKLVPFSLKSTFTDEEITDDLLKENPYYKKGDNALRDMVKDEEWIINAVTNLIIFSYKPHKVKLNNNMLGHLESYKTGEGIWDKLNEDFEITRNEKDKVDNKIMKDYIKGNAINISFPKIVNLYMSKGINNKPCKINNTTVRGFIGLKKINRYEAEDDDYLKSNDI